MLTFSTLTLKASSIANPEVYTTCEIEILDNLSEEELKVLDYIDKKKSVDIDSISKILKLNSTISTINKLLNKQILIADEQLFDKYSPKLEDYLVFGERCQTDAELKKRIAELENSKSAKNQLDVLLRFISDYKKNGFVKRIDFQQRNNALINSLKTLIKKDILAIKRFWGAGINTTLLLQAVIRCGTLLPATKSTLCFLCLF